MTKISEFFAKFLSEIPFLFLAGVLFNSIWILPNRLPPLFPNFSQIFKESHFTVRTLQRLKHTKIPFYRIPILPRELCSAALRYSSAALRSNSEFPGMSAALLREVAQRFHKRRFT